MENILQSQNVFDIIPRQDKSIDLGVGEFKIWVQPCKGYSTLQGAILATEDSAIGGLKIEQSLKDDGPTCLTTYDIVNTFTISAGISFKFGIPIVGEKIRITYTNGANPGNVRVGAYLFPVGLYFDVEDLRRKLEPSYDTGQVTEDCGATELIDSDKDWKVDVWVNLLVEITEGHGTGQIRKIIANDATTLTIDTDWTENPDAENTYRIMPAGTLWVAGNVDADIVKWGGIAQTGEDLTLFFRSLRVQPVPPDDVSRPLIPKPEVGQAVPPGVAPEPHEPKPVVGQAVPPGVAPEPHEPKPVGRFEVLADNPPLPTEPIVPTHIGQDTITLVGGVAEPLTPFPTPCKKVVMVSNIGNNAAGIRIGGAGLLATTGVYIAPGSSFTIEIIAVDLIYVWGTAGDVIDYTYTS